MNETIKTQLNHRSIRQFKPLALTQEEGMVNSRLDVRVLYCHFSTSRLGQNAVARTVQRNSFC